MARPRDKVWALTVRLGGAAVHQRLAAALKADGEQGCAPRLVELAMLGLLAEEAGFTQASVRGELTLVSPRALRRPAAGGERPVRPRRGSRGTVSTPRAVPEGPAPLALAPVLETVVNPAAASAWDALRSQFG